MSRSIAESWRLNDAPSPSSPSGRQVILFVCSTCRRSGDAEDGPRIGGIFHATIREAAIGVAGIAVREVKCLASCSRAPVVAISRPGGWAYLFGDLDPSGDATALIDGALLLRGSSDGVLPWRGRPDCLKRNMVGRLPPADTLEETLP